MEIVRAGYLGYVGAAVGYGCLTLVVLYHWSNTLSRAIFVSASFVTALWAAATAVNLRVGDVSTSAVLEIARCGAWLLLPLSLLNWVQPARRSSWAAVLIALCVALATLTLLAGEARAIAPSAAQLVVIAGHLALSLVGLALVENLLRNSSSEHAWSVKYLCFGLGALFAYDFFLYSDALLFRRLDQSLFLARGITNLFSVPLLVVHAKRARTVGPHLTVSRRFVFHTATLIGAGLYLMTMAAAGYYVRQVGGTWSTFLQAIFFFGAVLLLILPIASASFRASLRVLIEKNFFKYKYDYRAEWLRFIKTISRTDEPEGLRRRVIRAVCDIVDSPEGALWIRRDGAQLALTATWNVSRWHLVDAEVTVPVASTLAIFLQEQQWIIDIGEHATAPHRYETLGDLPEWLRALPRAWLVIPLLQHERLFGFMVLGQPRAERLLTWEDFDILKTVGRQAASYLAQQESDEALMEARQFEAFNKRFAFVAHDIKNLASQLSLILKNSARHRGNVDFQNDMIETVRQSVDKLNRMLRQLHAKPNPAELVDLSRLLSDIARQRRQADSPVTLDLQSDAATVAADENRLKAVVDHLVQNALDAVGANGHVEIRLRAFGAMAAVEIEDDGPGMAPEFVREQLFRPFASTKASGYGIGVYESREYARSLGGALEVISRPGEGTIMRMSLPTVTERAQRSLHTSD